MWDITDGGMATAYNPTYTAPPTIAPELPDYSSWGQTGGTSVPAPVSTGSVNMPGGLEGFIQGAAATAESLVKAWGIFSQVKQTAQQQQVAAKIAESDLKLRHAQVNNATDLQKIQSAAAVEIGRAQAAAAVAEAQAKADAAKNGGVVYVAGQGGMSMTTILGIAALGLAAFKLLGNRGKK